MILLLFLGLLYSCGVTLFWACMIGLILLTVHGILTELGNSESHSNPDDFSARDLLRDKSGDSDFWDRMGS